jgi:toxin ParE1/3/4
MADYKPSAATTAVLQPIYRYTARTFGSRQAESHAGGLKQSSGLFRFPYQSHIIFYTIEPTHIVIRRVLHDRMDFATRI